MEVVYDFIFKTNEGGILVIGTYLAIGLLFYVKVVKEPGAEPGGFGFFFSLLGWPIFLILMGFFSLSPDMVEERKKEKKKKARKKQSAQRALKQKEARIQIEAAKLVKNKELFKKLLQLKQVHQDTDEALTKAFIEDCVMLAEYVGKSPVDEFENRKALLDLMRFARINVYTFFDGESIKIGDRHAEDLSKAITVLTDSKEETKA